MLTWILGLADGYKTYAAGLGLMGLAAYQLFSQHDTNAALQSFLGGLAALGLRNAIAKAAA